jgi:hypothetical protein
MREAWRRGVVAAAGALGVLAMASGAPAVEYRLQVANLWENGFVALLRPGELDDGASGPGLNALETALDRGEVGAGVALPDRHVQPMREAASRAWGGVRVIPQEVKAGGEGKVLWDEVRWEGRPGEQSVWLVKAISLRPQWLYRTALKGQGPMRQFVPYTVPIDIVKLPAIQLPLDFLWFYEERGTIWERYVARRLDLGLGIGVVVGANFNPSFPDWAYLVVRHAEQPTVYKAVLAWRERPSQIQAPAGQKNDP